MKKIVWGLLALFLFSCGTNSNSPEALPGYPKDYVEDHILFFGCDITVEPEGSFLVEETIRVSAGGPTREIQRGIFRDFPVVYPNEKGMPYVAAFDVLEITRNGRPEPWLSQSYNFYDRIYLGEEDVFLNRGVHEYKIRYRTDRQLRFFEEYDEIYWNVTGNYWAFSIDKVEVIIRLPEGAEVVQKDAYTGPLGDVGKDFTAKAEGGMASFASTRPLRSQEGMTVAVGFTKGVVPPLTPDQTLSMVIWRDWRYAMVSAIVLVVLLLVYIVLWRKHGVDPPRGVLIPRFRAPAGMGPGVAGNLYFNKQSNHLIAALFLELGLKGYVKITQSGRNKFKIASLNKEREPGLSKESDILFDGLFHWKHKLRNTVELDGTYKIYYAQAVADVQRLITTQTTKYISHPTGFVVFLTIVSAATNILMMVMNRSLPEHSDAVYLGYLLGLVSMALLSIIFPLVCVSWIIRASNRIVLIHWVLGALWLLAAFWIYQDFPVRYTMVGGWIMAGHGLLNGIFANLLWRPTAKGRTLLDELLGLRYYLSVAEQERIRQYGPPEMTTSLYESLLPYAVALGAEHEWTRKFRATLSPQEQTAYDRRSTVWYTGGRTGQFTSGAVAAMSSGLSSASSSASTAPSSSGSGGGGSSGGGGGGGGGGGW